MEIDSIPLAGYFTKTQVKEVVQREHSQSQNHVTGGK